MRGHSFNGQRRCISVVILAGCLNDRIEIAATQTRFVRTAESVLNTGSPRYFFLKYDIILKAQTFNKEDSKVGGQAKLAKVKATIVVKVSHVSSNGASICLV